MIIYTLRGGMYDYLIVEIKKRGVFL